MQTIYSDASTDTICAYLKDSPIKAFTRKNEEVALTVQNEGFIIVPAGHRVRVPTGLTVDADDKGFIMQTAGITFTNGLQFTDSLIEIVAGDLYIDVMNISEISVAISHGDKLGKVVLL